MQLFSFHCKCKQLFYIKQIYIYIYTKIAMLYKPLIIIMLEHSSTMIKKDIRLTVFYGTTSMLFVKVTKIKKIIKAVFSKMCF